MIVKWKVANFKSIQETTELEFSPLTIFAGANSSGKSAFIQSILLMAQSLAHKVDTRNFVLNGALANLGQFNDLRSDGGHSDQITMTCTYRRMGDQNSEGGSTLSSTSRGAFFVPWVHRLHEIACEVSFDAESIGTNDVLLQIQPRLVTSELSCKIKDENSIDRDLKISIKRSKEIASEIKDSMEEDPSNEKSQTKLAYSVELDEISMNEVKEDLDSARAVGCQIRHFLPDEIVVKIDRNELIAKAITLVLQGMPRVPLMVRRSISGDELLPEEVIKLIYDLLKDVIDFDKVEWLDSLPRLPFPDESFEISVNELRRWVRRLPVKNRTEVEQEMRKNQNLFNQIYATMNDSSMYAQQNTESYVLHELPRLLQRATRKLEDFFVSYLKYLGPLRDAPKPLYPIGHVSDPDNVGLRGEHSASVLELRKNKKIRYIPTKNFTKSVINLRYEEQSLEVAVNDWLQYLGIATIVKSQYQGKLGQELKVKFFDSVQMHDLTHVGVGVSQVLPILVTCLLADPDATLIFEQPELHLHPSVQTLLGDFFLSMALCNKQCIVETHSEYFIDRLRYRIASSVAAQELQSKVKIYFVEKTSNGSSFREVAINQYGAISDWPKGFFDQSQQEAQRILTEAAKKRHGHQSNNNA